MSFQKIVIFGAGVMGRGISRVVAATGTEVVLIDRTTELADRGIEGISESMDKEMERWGITPSEKKAILSRITAKTDIKEAAKVPMVIEAIPEDLGAKKSLFKQLDQICRPNAILVTNTSTLSITELAAETKRPDKVIGMHFLNPVVKVPLVEVVRGLKTSDQTFDSIKEFASELGKTVISVSEYPGYVTTRIIVPMLNEAMHVLMERIATADDIDNAIKLGFGLNIGPLSLADQMGLDEVMSWMENLLKELSDHKYNPCPLLRKMVRAGHLGVKTGQGFFKYNEDGNRIREDTGQSDS
ncbi:MAG: 3-hydroxybutyryl-CoA dehydrogenase [candidate division Zixibacteria bacterium CG_4_9_14_3_um_filter_46_8]|nr:MAG: 3-hydroxybutyryl-CoA dehydrogenase [candidate division Zixibacteria bacterium CG_4_9_14_3_um_filter_46_8]